MYVRPFAIDTSKNNKYVSIKLSGIVLEPKNQYFKNLFHTTIIFTIIL